MAFLPSMYLLVTSSLLEEEQFRKSPLIFCQGFLSQVLISQVVNMMFLSQVTTELSSVIPGLGLIPTPIVSTCWLNVAET